MASNPYLQHEDEYNGYRRNAIVDQLAPEPRRQPRVRTPPPIEETRERLAGPGGRTSYMDPAEAADIGRAAMAGVPDVSNPFSGEVGQDVYQPPSTSPRSTGAQPRETGQAHPSNPQRGFQLMDAYDDPYTRRNEGSPGVGASAARGASIGSGAGPIGAGVGAAAGAIAALFSKNAPTAMTDFRIEDARQIISQAHRDALGRDITPQELDQTIRGQGWEPGDRWMGQDQLAYVLDQFAQHAAAEQAARGPEQAGSPATGTTPAGATTSGTGGGLPFSGFDFGRAQDPSKSAKDAFASLAQQAPQLTDTSKEGAEAWFRQHIAPGLEAAGYKVFDVQGDKAWIGSREDPEGRVPVDYLINAGGSNPQIGWQPDGGGMVGGGAAGDAPSDIQGAYSYLKSIAHPGMSRAEMEAAVTQAFGNVPGFEKAYAGDVVINGRKIDLITNFEGPGASWSDNLNFVPLHGGGGGGGVVGTGATAGVNLAPGVALASPLGNSNVLQEIMAEIARLQRGEAPRAAIVDQLGAGA